MPGTPPQTQRIQVFMKILMDLMLATVPLETTFTSLTTGSPLTPRYGGLPVRLSACPFMLRPMCSLVATPTRLLSTEDGQRFGLKHGDTATLTAGQCSITGVVSFGAVRAGCAWVHQADLLDDEHEWRAPGWRLANLARTEAPDGSG